MNHVPSFKYLQRKMCFMFQVQILLMVAIPESLSYVIPQQQMYRQRGVGNRQAKLSLADWSSYNYREPEGNFSSLLSSAIGITTLEKL